MASFRELRNRVPGYRPAFSRRTATFWGAVVVLVLCSVFLLMKHQTWVFQANAVQLGTGSDGVKNYMTTSWHVWHDKSAVHYDGMNYPFGEHVLFTDNQPVFSSLLQWWSRNVSPLEGRVTGLLNISLLFSIAFGSMVMFFLARKLHMPVWYAALISLGLAFLSPQFNRLDGHFGLSHIFVLPLLLYLLCVYEERSSRRYQSLLIGMLVWFSAQLHFYFFGVAALFLSLYTVIQILSDFNKRTFWRRISHWVIMVLLPFTLLNGWIHWSDYASDRPSVPYGFLVYIGQWEGVFLPYKSWPLYQFIDQNLVSIRPVTGESEAYAGMVVTLFTLWLIISRFKMFGKNWDEMAYHRVHKRYLRGIFLSALGLLLFACGFPFAIPGMEWMVNYMGPLRQFRGLGRFTWVYFYVVNLIAFYSVWNWSKRFEGIKGNKMRWLKYAVPALALSILAVEAVTLQVNRKIEVAPSLENKKILAAQPEHWLNKFDFSSYQALLPLPYYHMGSENIWLEFELDHFKKVQSTALHTGIPDMGVNMSRTPAHQTVESIQFVLEPCELPTMLNELPDNRPVAALVEPKYREEVMKQYPHLISKAPLEYQDDQLLVYRVEPDSVRAYVREHRQNLISGMENTSLFKVGKWLSTREKEDFFYASFNEHKDASRIFQGGGAMSGNMRDTMVLMEQYLPSGYHYVSGWIYADQDLGMNHMIKIQQEDPNTGEQRELKQESLSYFLRTIVNGWGLFDMPFYVPEGGSNVKIYLHRENTDQEFSVDEILVKPADITLYRNGPDWFVMNNFWYRK